MKGLTLEFLEELSFNKTDKKVTKSSANNVRSTQTSRKGNSNKYCSWKKRIYFSHVLEIQTRLNKLSDFKNFKNNQTLEYSHLKTKGIHSVGNLMH